MVAEAFREGGAMMFVAAVLGLAAIVAGILHAAFARRWSLVVGLVHVPLPLLAGIAGWLVGRAAVARALSYGGGLDPALHGELEAQSLAEARIPLLFGAGIFVLAAVPFAVGVARQIRRAG